MKKKKLRILKTKLLHNTYKIIHLKKFSIVRLSVRLSRKPPTDPRDPPDDSMSSPYLGLKYNERVVRWLQARRGKASKQKPSLIISCSLFFLQSSALLLKKKQKEEEENFCCFFLSFLILYCFFTFHRYFQSPFFDL